MAIASVEAYRALVNEVSSAHPIPKQVSLLDYAGFKFDALLKADAVDWTEIGRALDFADATWNEIASRVTDATLRDNFANSLTVMRTAADKKNKAEASAAAQRELALVDDLEKYFAGK